MIYRGDFTIHWTGKCPVDGLAQEYGIEGFSRQIMGSAIDSWSALQFAKSLGEHAEIRLHGVTLLVLGRNRPSDHSRLDSMEKVISANFNNPSECDKPIEARHRKSAS